MAAKRKLDFSTPSSKRSKTSHTSGRQTLSKAILKTQELKRYLITSSNTVAGHAVKSLVSNIATGTGGNERIGNKIKVLSIDYCVAINNSTSTQSGPARIRLVMARGQTTPFDGNPPTSASFTSFLDENQYWVLQDEIVTLSNSTSNSRAAYLKSHKFPSGLNLIYSANDVLQKNVFLIIEMLNGTTGIGLIQYSAQVNFKEI